MMFEKLSNNLNLLMAEARLNANELARQTGIPASSIKKIRNNNNPNPTLTTLAPLANFFSITVSQLVGDTPLLTNRSSNMVSLYNQGQRIPVIKWNDVTHWPSPTISNHHFIITERSYGQHSFGLIIEKESCECFPKGTLLIIDPDTPIQQSDYVLVLKEDQKNPVLKQILIEEDDIFLKSLLIKDHITLKKDGYKILGVVVEHRKYLR